MQIYVRGIGGDAGTSALDVHPSNTVAEVKQMAALKSAVAANSSRSVIMSDALRLVHCSRTLDDGCTLASAGVDGCSTLELLPRLRGGGGDGGATGAESRSCYLEMYAKKKLDKVGEVSLRFLTIAAMSSTIAAPATLTST